jgi:Transcriptional regulator PadR-like family
MHGYALAQHIKSVSADLLQIEEGSLYPGVAADVESGVAGSRDRHFGSESSGANFQIDKGRFQTSCPRTCQL